ncbi:Putative N-acetyl-LL-diaminopimelate aminotransferase [archaeon HR06]|nr:Putative N-acetyl-LL-diaminopimelate aminotransferase [archaeon HR06]
MLTVGSTSGLFATLQTLLNDGDEILLPNPYYPPYYNMSLLANGKVNFYTQKFEKDFDIDLEELKEKVSERVKVLLLCYPNNPTGYVVNKSKLHHLAQLAKEYNLWVISDEVYSKFVYDEEFCSIVNLKGMKDRTIVINSASKSYGMTGWRIGWVLAREDLIKDLVKIHHTMVIHPDVIAQRALLEALNLEDSFFEELKKEYKERRDLVASHLKEIEGLQFSLPKGAFYFFPKFLYNLNSKDFVKYLVKEAKVLLVPGISFGENWDKHFRLTYCYSKEKLEEALSRIKRALKKFS